MRVDPLWLTVRAGGTDSSAKVGLIYPSVCAGPLASLPATSPTILHTVPPSCTLPFHPAHSLIILHLGWLIYTGRGRGGENERKKVERKRMRKEKYRVCERKRLSLRLFFFFSLFLSLSSFSFFFLPSLSLFVSFSHSLALPIFLFFSFALFVLIFLTLLSLSWHTSLSEKYVKFLKKDFSQTIRRLSCSGHCLLFFEEGCKGAEKSRKWLSFFAEKFSEFANIKNS